MQDEDESRPGAGNKDGDVPPSPPGAPPRLNSRDLLQGGREVEIVHENRVYRLRVTQQNKLILTA